MNDCKPRKKIKIKRKNKKFSHTNKVVNENKGTDRMVKVQTGW